MYGVSAHVPPSARDIDGRRVRSLALHPGTDSGTNNPPSGASPSNSAHANETAG
jgi:hypothetical protein